MANAEIPSAVLTPPSQEELDAVRLFAKRAMDSIGDGSLMHDPAKLNIAMAARQEVSARANLELIEGELVKLEGRKVPYGEFERLAKGRGLYRHRLMVALRDQGRLWEAMEYADTPRDQESMKRGFNALERDDDDFDCPAGCEDDVAMLENSPRAFTRWDRVKADIPRVVDGVVQMVTLWRCGKCGDYNASRLAPPSRRLFEAARAKAAPGTGDGDILPVVE